MASRAGNIADLELHGGRLCLDFVNSVSWRHGPAPREWLADYGDFVAWARHAGLIGARAARDLRAAAAREPKAALRAHGQAIALREALHRVFQASAEGAGVPRANLAELNRALAVPAPGPILARAGERYAWRAGALESLAAPIAWSAAELLASAQLARVKTCGAADCGWLFLDISRNKSRRWCSMDDCGNRAKARRHYARTRLSSPAP
jgi:predicted RNA-binding Zn ribbon-like protein